VAWNWQSAAQSPFWKAQELQPPKTPDQGIALGQTLQAALGPSYSRPIHFIGHSLGTLVNSYAANFLQGANFAGEPVSPTPWPATNMQNDFI